MAHCSKSEISDVLPMALAPSEFPDEISRIEDHLKDCEMCSKELDNLKLLETAIKAEKDNLRDAVAPCPSPEALFEFAMGEENDVIQGHLKLCSACAEELSLIRELVIDTTHPDTAQMPSHMDRLLRESVNREYGEIRSHWLHSVQEFFVRVASLFSFPSFAAGAAMAAMCLLLLAPWQSKELSLIPAGSNVVWKSGPAAQKEFAVPEKSDDSPKIALVIVLPETTQLSPQQIDEIYGKLSMPTRMGDYYNFLSPKELKGILNDIGGVKKSESVSGIVIEKTGPKYVLQFQISSVGPLFDLKASLFGADQKRELGEISQSRLPLSRIPSRMDSIGTELLLEAEAS